ncbi:predicted protein [Thalassiosira pseudonana CCMP1335]|uniref:Uncharacterized protein n=1 Tax=Thalassiosira pseudonana TaxID=35128 RepID=B8CG81_THAPS|nr:predicted protein [Thalassiosira pseudonana CCMP1335]EED87445.1 predicted protein [Thalassiosira pseudonana CCMP1335]
MHPNSGQLHISQSPSESMSRRPKRAKTSDSSSPPSPPVAELPPPFASAPVVVNDAVMEQLQHQSSTIASLNESVAHLRSMVNDLITSHSSLKKEVAVLRAASEQSQPHAPLAPTNEGNMMQQQQQVPHLPTMNAIQTERDSSLQLAATTYRLSPPAAAAAINDTTSRTTDEETDAIIADLKEKKQWPVKRNAFKRFSEDASLIKVRFHRSLKYQHLPVRITGDTKEGRLNCKLCAKKDVSRNTAWMCSSCEMPLCETIDLGSFSMIGCGARKRSQDIDSTASFNVSAGAILLAFGVPRVVLVAIFVAFGGWLFLVLDTLPTQLNRIHQQLHRKQLSPLASSNDNMNDLNDPSAVQMQRAVEAVAAEAADSLRVQVADRPPVAVGVAAAEPVKEDVLDQMHIDALVAAEPINVNEDDPVSVAACLRQVQSQLQQQIQVILAMKDKINELTVQRDTIQRELDSIKSSSKAPRTSTARGTPLPRNAAAMAHPLSHLGVTQDSTDVEIDAIFHAKKGGQLGGSQWPREAYSSSGPDSTH